MRILILVLVAIAVVIATFFWLNRPQRVQVHTSPPDGFPAEGFSHASFESLLIRRVSTSGEVDYEGWHADADDRATLSAYLTAVGRYSPVATPERFPTDQDALAYWMYSYNAWVIYSVLENWPIESVTDVRAPLEAVKGLGFFYRQRFLFGGEYLSLLTVENDRIRKRFRDPRIHFVLNCGSESCPVIRPELPTGEALEVLLEQATHEFLIDRRNVEIDTTDQRIELSAIFQMYRSDFVNDLRAQGLPAERGVIAWIESAAPDELRAQLAAAQDFEVVFRDFDWSLNSQ